MTTPDDTSTPSMKPLGQLVTTSTESAFHASDNCHPRTAEARARLMLKACPAPNRETDVGLITASIIKKFCAYSEATVLQVSDPVGGFPAKARFFPTLADIHDALEAIEAPKRVKQAAEQRIRETQQMLNGSQAEVSQEARDRAFEAWKAQKKEMQNEKSPEILKAEADRRLRDGWRDKRWDTTVNPVKVSDRLRANLDAKAKPDYVSLEVGQAQQGQIDDAE